MKTSDVWVTPKRKNKLHEHTAQSWQIGGNVIQTMESNCDEDWRRWIMCATISFVAPLLVLMLCCCANSDTTWSWRQRLRYTTIALMLICV